jgi:Zn-dependent M16 (insulinase) family peptidase
MYLHVVDKTLIDFPSWSGAGWMNIDGPSLKHTFSERNVVNHDNNYLADMLRSYKNSIQGSIMKTGTRSLCTEERKSVSMKMSGSLRYRCGKIDTIGVWNNLGKCNHLKDLILNTFLQIPFALYTPCEGISCNIFQMEFTKRKEILNNW